MVVRLLGRFTDIARSAGSPVASLVEEAYEDAANRLDTPSLAVFPSGVANHPAISINGAHIALGAGRSPSILPVWKRFSRF